MSDLKPGTICDYRDRNGNHIANVEIMVELADLGEKKIYICRRVNNGSLIAAWESDLKPEKQNE